MRESQPLSVGVAISQIAKSQSHSMKRLRPTSQSLALDDDFLAEFLLRLPPQPSTLPRFGLVCKRWRRLVTDPQFVRRFRAFHRRTPPLHGFIVDLSSRFVPTQEPPDRLPASRFSWHGWAVHCCRHGLVLCYRGESFASEFMVVDLMTRHRSHVGILQHEGAVILASTVLSVAVAGGGRGTADDRRSFVLVALFAQFATTAEALRLTASVYSSDSGTWASAVAAVFPPSPFNTIAIHHPSSLVGNAIYRFRATTAPSGPTDAVVCGSISAACPGSCRQLAMAMAAFAWPSYLGVASSSGRGRQSFAMLLQTGCCARLFSWTRFFQRNSRRSSMCMCRN